jgi:cyclase
MLASRVIPCLLLQHRGLVKTLRFKNPIYIGDAVNAVKIFNEKEVDELIFLDITASKKKREPNFTLISELASECFMPFAYGGGITTVDQIWKILQLGVEKVIINHSVLKNTNLLRAAVKQYGSSTIIVAIDVKKDFFGRHRVYDHVKQRTTDKDPIKYAKEIEQAGAGELFINDVDRDGTYTGYNLPFFKTVADLVSIPVIACGGASSLDDFKAAVTQAGVSAVAAGSFFVFQRPHRAVLISYPAPHVLEKLFK